MNLDASARPRLIIISGRPGSGKTTLARALSQAIPCPLVSRDEINEGIRHALSAAESPTKEQVAKLAFDAFFRTISLLVSCNVTLVAEAAFQDRLWRQGLEPVTSTADIKIVHCEVGEERARERTYQRRLREQEAVRSRPGWPIPPEEIRRPEARAFEPLSLPAPYLRVDTGSEYAPSFDEILLFAGCR